jgi:hypothetical protein
MQSASGEFEIASWNEETYHDLEGDAKMTRASVEQTFSGDLSGEGGVEWLMCYGQDGTARFVGLQRFEGTLAGRRGSFVVDSVGDFNGEEAKGAWAVVAGSGTGELLNIKGHGNFNAPMGGTPSWTFDYLLD